MAKSKTKKEKNEEVKDDFNIESMYESVNPYLREGLKEYIFENNIKITNEKEFKKVYNKYGGFLGWEI